MPQNSPSAAKIRFGAFEAHLPSGELYKQGRKVRLQGLPFQVLEALLLRSGQLVSREELCRRLWPEGTFVDFDNSLNSAVNRLREALGDSAANPRFVETVPGRGYRFIAPAVQETEPPEAPALPAPADRSGFGPWLRGMAGAGLVLLALALAFLGLQRAGWIGGQGRLRLAVLPFANLSGDSAQDYFGDGLTDEMIARLGRLDPRRLGVIARRSAMRYKGSDKPVGQIASELDVDYLLEGTVRQQGERVRITARLVQAEDGTQLWSASFDRNLQEVLDVQQDVAARVARSLALRLLPGSAPPDTPAPCFDSLAYDAYLKGRYHWNKQGPQAVLKAVEHFRQSIEHDPEFAPAHAGLADCYNFLAGAGHQQAVEAYRAARQSAVRAVELDDSLAEGHAALGVVHLFADRNLESARRELERALELNPGLSTLAERLRNPSSTAPHKFLPWKWQFKTPGNANLAVVQILAD
ncbi:MAG: winged helix-turn-helix domain-containing protein [Acidobacteriota bacterium]